MLPFYRTFALLSSQKAWYHDSMLDIVMIGSGWRSLFYARAATMIPSEFHLSGWMVHSSEKLDRYRKTYQVFVSQDMDAVLKQKHDLVVLCVPDTLNKEFLLRLAAKDERILTETSFLKQPREDLTEILEKTKGRTIEVAEQYPWHSYHQQVHALCGHLGPIRECTVGSCHFHHAVSLLRGYLDEGFSGCTIEARTTSGSITQTGGRYGYDDEGKRKKIVRTMAILRYADGKTGYYDFTGEEYHSTILSGHFALRGERGEIFDREARYLDDRNQTVVRHLDGGVRDEDAIAECLRHFGDGYSLAEGLWDAVTGQAIIRAAETEKAVVLGDFSAI